MASTHSVGYNDESKGAETTHGDRDHQVEDWFVYLKSGVVKTIEAVDEVVLTLDRVSFQLGSIEVVGFDRNLVLMVTRTAIAAPPIW